MITAISIGIAVGVFLYKTGILNISKLSNGLLYGLLAGSIVFVVFFIPVYQFISGPRDYPHNGGGESCNHFSR